VQTIVYVRDAVIAASVAVPLAAFVPVQSVAPDAVQLVAAGAVLHVSFGTTEPAPVTVSGVNVSVCAHSGVVANIINTAIVIFFILITFIDHRSE
jgi:hypothetical protein